MKVWHFLRKGGITNKGSLQVIVGQTMSCDPDKIKPGVFGFHGSVRALDALTYAPDVWVQYAELGGKIIIPRIDDKHVASERTCLAMADATDVLLEFAEWCAERSGNNYLQREALPLNFAQDASEDALRAAAAGSDAWDAARLQWYAEEDKQNTKLEEMLRKLLGV